jgi:diguanylate cyclase (GGDEF)-like protein/PAS domain S-box-containing protein
VNQPTLPVALVPALRILVIDDNPAIHEDFRKIFGAGRHPARSAAEQALFGGGAAFNGTPEFALESAYQGEEGLALVRRAQDGREPYAMAFVDVRMPPGWDGLETVRQIWRHDADIQIVICTAYSDYSWSEMLAKLGRSDRLVILKKPFDTIEVVQLASALTEKWRLARESRSILQDLERRVADRTRELVHKVEELRASENLKGAILESSLEAIVTIDHAGKVLEFNPAAEATFGWTREQALGKVMVDLIIPPRLREAHRQGFAHYLATGQGPILGKRIELEALRADGSEFPVELAITAIGATAAPMFTGFIRDITARREATEKIRRLNRVYAVLSGINSLIVRERQRDELFAGACRIALEAGGFRLAWIGVVDESRTQLKPVAWQGGDPDYLARMPLSLDSASDRFGLVGRAVCQKSPIIVHDMQRDARVLLRNEAGERNFHSLIVLPLMMADTVTGVLALYAAEIGFFDQDETRLALELAADLSFALANMANAEKLERSTRVNATLSGINGAIVRIREPQALFDEACRIAVEAGGFALAWIGTVARETNVLLPVAWAGLGRELSGTMRLALGDAQPSSLAALAMREKGAVYTNDIENDSRIAVRAELLGHGLRSAILIPLLVHGEAVGVIGLISREKGFFTEGEIRVVNELAANIAFALEHIEKEAKVRRLTRVYAVLSGINTLIVRTRDRGELFKEACRIAVEAGGFRMSLAATVEPATLRIVPVASAGKDQALMDKIKALLCSAEDVPRTMLARAILEKRAVVSNDIRGDPQVLFAGYGADGVRAIAVLPLVVSDTVVGAFALYSEEAGFFDAQELTLLTELAGDIAFALDHIDKAEKLDYLAYYDPLTGLANRSLLLERVAQYLRSAAAGGHPLALFLIDLERFKNINDSLGRTAGDALLQQVGQWITRQVGDASLVARLGADQFAVVLPQITPGGNVAHLLEKAVDALLAHPFRLNDAVFRVAAKVGVALFPDDAADADTLFRNAEAALKKAKAGGERYLFHTQKMTEAVAGKLTLENQLRQALDREEFVLHYQPKVSLESGKLTGAEALIRWNDPRTGLVPPGRFIPVLEETGLINEAGRWALRKSIEEYLRWCAAGLPAVRVAVNVSPLQLRNRGFIEEIRQVVGIHAQAAAGLELEITESLIMEDVKHSIASLKAIRAMGVTVAIDDFGTGFSSLSYLSKLPVDTLKIDRSFVLEMTAGPQGLALVSTIITLAHSLKRKVVAEGVETEEQSRLLHLLGCDEMQGYLFSKPVPAALFEERFLAKPAAL